MLTVHKNYFVQYQSRDFLIELVNTIYLFLVAVLFAAWIPLFFLNQQFLLLNILGFANLFCYSYKKV